MSAPKRNFQGSTTLMGSRLSGELSQELRRLEKVANERMRRGPVQLSVRYHGEVVDLLWNDLLTIFHPEDWRSGVERAADRLKSSAKLIHRAVSLLTKAVKDCPRQSLIPELVWRATLQGKAEEQRINNLPDGEKLFGTGGAIESLNLREQQKIIDVDKLAPSFLKAMLVYSANCKREAERLDLILKAREKRYDPLGPILSLIKDVYNFTALHPDKEGSLLLTIAHEAGFIKKSYSSDVIEWLRKRYLPSLCSASARTTEKQ